MKGNKVIGVLLALVLFFSTATVSAAANQQLTFAGSQAGGTWFIFCGAVAQMVNKYMPGYDATPAPSSGSFENVRGLRDGLIDGALILPNITHAAYNGEKPWIDPKYEGLRGIFNAYSFPYMIVTRADSDIRGIADFKGKRIASGPPGSAETTIFEDVILAQYGMTGKDLGRIWPLSDGERSSALIDKQADVGLFLTGVAAPTLKELTTTCDTRFIPIEPQYLENIAKTYSYFTMGNLKADTFRLQTEDIPSIIMWGQFCCTEETDEEFVYQLVKTVFEHKAEIEEIMPLFKEVNLQTATVGMSMPLHPGAIRYYREQGIEF